MISLNRKKTLGLPPNTISMDHKTACIVCGDGFPESSGTRPVSCYYCSTPDENALSCLNGHYVCENCKELPVNQRILAFCLQTNVTDPVAIAVELMDSHGLLIHGPEHHFLVPAGLMTAYLNFTGQQDLKESLLTEIHDRARLVPGGFCWTNGTCGAAIGVGTFISVLLKTHPLSEREWQLSNLATARALDAIARSGGPRCCKRDTFIGLLTARVFLEELLQIKLPGNQQIVCRYHHLNSECTHEQCMFYNPNA